MAMEHLDLLLCMKVYIILNDLMILRMFCNV